MIQLVAKQKKSQFRYYQMVLHTFENLIHVKEMLGLIRVEGLKKTHINNFPPLISKNVGIRPQNFVTFSFNPFIIE